MSSRKRSRKTALPDGTETIKDLQSIKKRVFDMVVKDKERKSSGFSPDHDSPCGCPNNCNKELQKLRKYIEKVLSTLGENNPDAPLLPLGSYVTDIHHLLTETWKAVGITKLASLVPADILAICARRERRDAKHPPPDINSFGSPPFCFLKDIDIPDSSSNFSGVNDFWRRCLRELRELTVDDIKYVLEGTSIPISISLNTNESKPPVDITKSKSPNRDNTSCLLQHIESNAHQHVNDSVETYDDSPAPPKNTTAVAVTQFSKLENKGDGEDMSCKPVKSDGVDLRDRVHQEIAELEFRARAIRSMLNSDRVHKPALN